MFGVFALLDRLSGLKAESSYHRLETLSRELLKVRAFIVGLGAASFVLLGLSGFLEISVVPILILFTVLFCLNFAYAWLISFRHSLELVCFLQLLVDALATTTAIYMTGGSQSVVSVGYFVLIVAVSVVLSPRFGMVAAGVCTVVFSILVVLERLGFIPPIYGASAMPGTHFYYFSVFLWMLSYAGAVIVGSALHGIIMNREGEIVRSREILANFNKTLERLVNKRTEQLTQAKTDLESKNTELVALNRVKSEFLATVSHELRTPLTTLRGYVEMMSGGLLGDLTSEQKDSLVIMDNKSQSLEKLIRDLLDVAQLEAGTELWEFEELDLCEIAAEVADDLKHGEGGDRILLETFDVPLMIRADKKRLVSVIGNLLQNALKFSSDSNEPVGLSFGQDSKEVWMSVQDKGIGIPEDLQDKIFERFFQVDSSDVRRFGGTGLGLFLVKEIIEKHDGNIKLESVPGTGTRFTVRFPLSGSAVEGRLSAADPAA